MARKRSEAREWIEALPGGAYFFASEVPGSAATVKPLLSRLAADLEHPVERQMRGFYYMRWGQDGKTALVNRVGGALKLVGAGGGGAGLFAVNRARWTYQHPCRYDFAVMGRPPASPWPTVRFRRRSNLRRDVLTTPEVTLIEAVRYYDRAAPIPWDEAMESVRDGTTARNLSRSGHLRPDALRWAAEHERCQPAAFHDRISEACDALAASDCGTVDAI